MRDSHAYAVVKENRGFVLPNEIVAQGTFDPFTNPSDCARVMDEVVKRGIMFKFESPKLTATWQVDWRTYLFWRSPERGHAESYGESWTEAFCLAVLEMIGEG